MGDAHEALWLCGFRCTGSFGLCVVLEGVTHLSSPPCPAHTHFLAALCLFTAAASGANITWSLQEAKHLPEKPLWLPGTTTGSDWGQLNNL